MATSTVITTTEAERERRVAEAIHSGEMEGLHVSAAGQADAGEYIAGRIDSDELVCGMSRDRFINRPSHHYDAVNYVHPFREGNGRTQRVFWNRVARDAGWQLDWRGVRGSTNDEACRAASERSRLSFPTSATRAIQRAPDQGTERA